MRLGHLRLQNSHLRRIESLIADFPEHRGEIRARDGTHIGGDVRESRAEVGEGAIEKVVPWRDALDLVQGRVACSDDGYRAWSHARAVERCEPATCAQGFEGANDVGESGRAVGLEVDEEVEGLGAGGVVDAIVGGTFGEEGGRGVLALEDGENGIDVKGREGAAVGESAFFVANV